MPNNPSLSICMIVKNEEAMLPRCLRSIRDFADEIIIVDTGSTDRSIEIAEEFKAKVYHHKWEDNFAFHRNQAIEKASKDWILMLDADEELKEGSGEILKEAIKNKEIDSIKTTNISFFNHGQSEAWVDQIRVFRNKLGIHYKDIVHEQLLGIVSTKKYPVFINHYGYDLGKDHSEKKHIRNVQLIKEQIKNDPDNFYFHLNLAVSYSTHFEFHKAVEEGLAAVKLAEQKGIQDDNNLLWANYIVSSAYFKLKDFRNAEKFAYDTIAIFPEHYDSYFILAMVYHQKEDWEKLLNISDKLLNFYNNLKQSSQNIENDRVHMIREEWRVHLAMGDLYLHRNDLKKAEDHFNTALSLSSTPAVCNRIIGDCFSRAGFQHEAESKYKTSFAQNGNPEACFGLAMLYKNSKNMKGYRNMIENIDLNNSTNPDFFFEKGLISLKEEDFETSIDLFKKAISLNPDFFSAMQNLSLAYKYSGKLEESLEIGLKALELQPDSVDIKINLGHLCSELNELELATQLYEGILETEPEHFDVRLSLSEIYIKNGEIEKSVYECDQILKELDLPRDMTLNSISDLAGIFLAIADEFNQKGSNQLSTKAEEIAFLLDSQAKIKTAVS